MKIIFNPQKAENQTVASIANNMLTYNGESIDLKTIPNGATATNEYITIDKAIDESITITMLWQYIEDTAINRFPLDIDILEGEIKPQGTNYEF